MSKLERTVVIHPERLAQIERQTSAYRQSLLKAALRDGGAPLKPMTLKKLLPTTVLRRKLSHPEGLIEIAQQFVDGVTLETLSERLSFKTDDFMRRTLFRFVNDSVYLDWEGNAAASFDLAACLAWDFDTEEGAHGRALKLTGPKHRDIFRKQVAVAIRRHQALIKTHVWKDGGYERAA